MENHFSSYSLPPSKRACNSHGKRIYCTPPNGSFSSMKLSASTRRSFLTYSITSVETRRNLLQLVPAIPYHEFEAERRLFRVLTQDRTSELRAGQLATALNEHNSIIPAVCHQILDIFHDCDGALQPLSLDEFCIASACCRLHTLVGVPSVLAAWQHQLCTQNMPTPPFLCEEPTGARMHQSPMTTDASAGS